MGLQPWFTTRWPAVWAKMQSAARIQFGLDSLLDVSVDGYLMYDILARLGVPKINGLVMGACASSSTINANCPLSVNGYSRGYLAVQRAAAIQATVSRNWYAPGRRCLFNADASGTIGVGHAFFAVYPTSAQRTTRWKGGDPFPAGDTVRCEALISRTVGSLGVKSIGMYAWRGDDTGVIQGGAVLGQTVSGWASSPVNPFLDIYAASDETFDVFRADMVSSAGTNPTLAIGKYTGTTLVNNDIVDIAAVRMSNISNPKLEVCVAASSSASPPTYSGITSNGRNAWHKFCGPIDVLIYQPGANVSQAAYDSLAAFKTEVKAMIDADLAAQAAIHGKTDCVVLLIPTFDAHMWRSTPSAVVGVSLTNTMVTPNIEPRLVSYYENVEQACFEIANEYVASGRLAAAVNMYRAIGPGDLIVNVLVNPPDRQHPGSLAQVTPWVDRFNGFGVLSTQLGGTNSISAFTRTGLELGGM